MKSREELLNTIIKVLEDMGGDGQLQDIYDEIATMENNGLIDLSHLKKKNVAIRTEIYKYSSDSKNFNGDYEKDYFYTVDGKRSGKWGLRYFKPDDYRDIDITEDDTGFPEGKKKLSYHICRERNYKVIKLAKEKYKKQNGKLICEICGFDFEEEYGDIGKDFIEGHHTIPVSELNEGDKTKVEDIVLVCSNCHKMLHRKRPWLKPNELEKLLKNK